MLADWADGPDLHTADLRRGDLRGDLDCLVEVACLDQIEAGELLLRLGKRTVGNREAAVTNAHRGRGGHRLQRFGGDALPARAQLGIARQALQVVHLPDLLLLTVHQTQVFHRRNPRHSVSMLGTDLSAGAITAPERPWTRARRRGRAPGPSDRPRT